LIVYESMFGNTAAVARAISEGLAARGAEPTLVAVDDAVAGEIRSYDLLVVGGPTHAHGVSRAATRRTARSDERNSYDDPTKGEGLRRWIARLPEGGPPAAAFDTRLDAPALVTGSASKGIAARLRDRGYPVVGRESFLVTKQNTMVNGELELAATWGATLAGAARATARV
jgi:hypothetical protein